MDAKSSKRIVSGVYRVSIVVSGFSEGELELRDKFGDEMVQVGGTFSQGGITFTRPLLELPLTTGFPASQVSGVPGGYEESFDSLDSATAEQEANIWTAEIFNRLTQAAVNLRSNSDSFTSENTITI